MTRLFLLDYGAGNVRSLANSLTALGYEFEWIQSTDDFHKADKLIFPGVGAFGGAMETLQKSGLTEPLREYINSGKPYFGICIGMQVLFASSTENPEIAGLGVIPTPIEKFDPLPDRPVPHMGWNGVQFVDEAHKAREAAQTGLSEDLSYYFVHSFRAAYDPSPSNPSSSWAHSVTQYGQSLFLATVRKGNVFACQFHPEKSGPAGLQVLKSWLDAPISAVNASGPVQTVSKPLQPRPRDGFTKRIIACLDVRSNDAGDLVVTKGDQYQVREKPTSSDTTQVSTSGEVRNLGKPLDLTTRYYTEGADEICMLNITSFRNSPLSDQPMLAMTSAACARIHVPLTIGGGIRDLVEPDGTKRSALEVAGAYFRAGADKVSIGGDAVVAVEQLLERKAKGEPALTGQTSIESIARPYGSQAVVVSIDPLKKYVDDSWEFGPVPPEDELIHAATALSPLPSEKGTGKKWTYLCTMHGGRTVRPLTALQLARGVEELGAGELLVNCIDRDGQGNGYDLDLLSLIRKNVNIPVVASSGAGAPQHFVDVFDKTGVESALAAGIFHRSQVAISDVKEALQAAGILVRKV
ncbi:imidazole glycerol pho [Calocera viscosa TUFC12733]|uniref:Imidazole glycerol pho n=1 Tax=Calocera viscosa (strain TUFC12733) TaxID=1330018 RepID=A0A167P3Z8_CALVF|nr:imidazole glycerol pho [Calocera viscosa TUFC12733]